MTATDQEVIVRPERLALIGGQQLVLERGATRNVLTIVRADGMVALSVHLTAAGPVLRVEGAALEIHAQGDLALSAGRVSIHGREHLALTSGGDVQLHGEGDLHSEARIQNITAALGNVNVKANDDVKLNGERVMMNC